MFKRGIFSVLFYLLAQVANADNSEILYEPVTIKDSKMSLGKIIKFPKQLLKSKDDSAVVVRCDAFVNRNGRLTSNMCYEQGEAYYPYVTAINQAAERAVLNPGKVNGTARIVYFQYYVFFIKKSGKTSVEVIGNSGLEVEKYGTSYSSPQRYRESGGNFGSGCGFNKKITVNAVITEFGTASKVDVIGENLGEKCIKYLKESFMEQKFIPAMYKGKAISSYYSEQIFDVMRQQ